MCIIFYNEKGVAYRENELRNAIRTNHDGVGIMWIEGGKVQTYKGMHTADDLVKMMKDFEGTPHALHLRFATNGPVVKDLCHPFKATPDDADQTVYLMHNGVLVEHGRRAEDHESDTLVFARDRQADVAEAGGLSDIFFDDGYIAYMEQVISGDRMIFLRDDGQVVILNPGQWHRDESTGMWYSNQYSIRDRPSYSSYGWSYTGSSRFYGTPLTGASKGSTVDRNSYEWEGEDADEFESRATYPGITPTNPPPFKSAKESAKVLLADNPKVGDGEDEDEEDEILFFRWEGDEFVPCEEEEADIEVTAEEYFEHWTDDDEDEDEIEWD